MRCSSVPSRSVSTRWISTGSARRCGAKGRGSRSTYAVSARRFPAERARSSATSSPSACSACRVPDIRPAVLPDDADAIARIDTSFTTDTIYEVRLNDDGFAVTPTPVDPPIVKTFPIDGLGGWRAWERAWVATADDTVVGFCAV